MNTYENDVIGNIVIIKNMIFQNTVTNKQETDHAWNMGRPCLIIYSDNEYDYFLTLKSKLRNSDPDEQYYRIDEKNLSSRSEYRINNFNAKASRKKFTEGEVNLRYIYRIPISGHDEIAKVNITTYKKIMDKFKKFHNNNTLEEIMKKSTTIRK